jgi:elongator complex protein 3
MKQAGTECRCIRCREYGHRVLTPPMKSGRNRGEIGEPLLVRMDYEASGGKEVFLSFEDKRETLFGLLRLRVQSQPIARLGAETNGNLAIIRELHVYGPEVPLKQQVPQAVQHKGLGRALLAEAERLAREEFQARQMVVLSGVGAREYYRADFGYRSLGDYMVKSL